MYIIIHFFLYTNTYVPNVLNVYLIPTHSMSCYSLCHEYGSFSVHSLINIIYHSHSTQVAGGTFFRNLTVAWQVKSRLLPYTERFFKNQVSRCMLYRHNAAIWYRLKPVFFIIHCTSTCPELFPAPQNYYCVYNLFELQSYKKLN